MSADENYMRIALELAMKGAGSVSPNPRVGCVIVKGGQIIGRGWHERYGGSHAEVNAVRDAGGNVDGASVYVTLEPCSHYGRTPPCADMLVDKKVARVVIGMKDPNPKVNGSGAAKLRAAGIEVEMRVLEDECKKINKGFLMRIREGRPYVTLKVASSLDGKIALDNGESKWITGPEARKEVHRMRAENDAVLTGAGTVLADNPEFTVRDAPGRTPLRVIWDKQLAIPGDAKILDVTKGAVMIVTGSDSRPEKVRLLRGRGVSVELLECGKVFEVDSLLALLGEKGVNYLMVEAGPAVAGSFISSGKVDKLALFVAPKIIGRGKCWTDYFKIEKMDAALRVQWLNMTRMGSDLLIEGVFACSPDL